MVAFGGLLQRALCASPQSRLRRLLGSPVLVFFGFYSYGLYLAHFGVDTWLRLYLLAPLDPPLPLDNGWRALLAVLGLGLAIPLAMLTHRLVEAPALRLKRHLPGAAWSPAPPNPVALQASLGR